MNVPESNADHGFACARSVPYPSGWRHEAAKFLILCGVQPTVDKFQAAVWWRETVKIHILKQKTNGGRKYDLADKIVRLRKKNGWSQEELAQKMNVSRQAVSKWESAQTVPELEKILQLGALFGVTTDYLLRMTWSWRSLHRKR